MKQHIAGHGALGDFFNSKMNSIKMGDTPSVGWLLKGTPDDPSKPGWGGQFVRAWKRPYSRFDRLTTPDDQMEVFGVLELALPLGRQSRRTSPNRSSWSTTSRSSATFRATAREISLLPESRKNLRVHNPQQCTCTRWKDGRDQVRRSCSQVCPASVSEPPALVDR